MCVVHLCCVYCIHVCVLYVYAVCVLYMNVCVCVCLCMFLNQKNTLNVFRYHFPFFLQSASSAQALADWFSDRLTGCLACHRGLTPSLKKVPSHVANKDKNNGLI